MSELTSKKRSALASAFKRRFPESTAEKEFVHVASNPAGYDVWEVRDPSDGSYIKAAFLYGRLQVSRRGTRVAVGSNA